MCPRAALAGEHLEGRHLHTLEAADRPHVGPVGRGESLGVRGPFGGAGQQIIDVEAARSCGLEGGHSHW